ncbi:hypothetical protein HYH03_008375 [Edaphochlamys debaryana]|uniref:HYR domain-containing protein n=1 Tax=Edaphochlamys debaryana TaxID=47281 RepID=A0A835Y0D3_9CHLO|nr:hypothetical protein HYH03_008375 [Edaphochlamys debaryana]|eukprot:KAG2493561.1 hypothetical protein HYH03_008375 [Edaphochlamys debaryana]
MQSCCVLHIPAPTARPSAQLQSLPPTCPRTSPPRVQNFVASGGLLFVGATTYNCGYSSLTLPVSPTASAEVFFYQFGGCTGPLKDASGALATSPYILDGVMGNCVTDKSLYQPGSEGVPSSATVHLRDDRSAPVLVSWPVGEAGGRVIVTTIELEAPFHIGTGNWRDGPEISATWPAAWAVQENFIDFILDTLQPPPPGGLPVVAVPGDQTLGSADPRPFVISPAPSAVDFAGNTLPVDCTPALSYAFPLGETTVSCTATDGDGRTSGAKTFKVTVRDTTPPALTVPADFNVTGTTPTGATVNYQVSATDNAPGTVAISCSLLSGTAFAYGRTIVTCTATDVAGYSMTKTFSVIVSMRCFDGFLPPVAIAPELNTVSAAQTLPLKWSLGGDFGLDILACSAAWSYPILKKLKGRVEKGSCYTLSIALKTCPVEIYGAAAVRTVNLQVK